MLKRLLDFSKRLFCVNCVFLSGTWAYAIDFENVWTPLYKGVEYRLIVKDEKLKIHQIRIDNDDPDIDIFVTRPKANSTETVAMKTSTFLRQEKAQVVINGSGYSPASLSPEGVPKQCRSLAIYDGVQYGNPEKEDSAFVVLKDGRKKIIKMDEFDHYKKKISMAMGAWDYAGIKGLFIDDGKSCLPKEMWVHETKARSAIGISKDGKTLYMVVVEGQPRQRSIYKQLVSGSVSMPEFAEIMEELKCDRAMTLDAGGSATLVVENMINNKPIVLNIPSDHKGERALGSHIGLKAAYIKNKGQLKVFRALQESAAFFDLLNKSDAQLNDIYMNEKDLARLDEGDVTPINKLYERFGVGQYIDSVLDYSEILESKGKSFEECFYKDNQYGFYCGRPKEFFDGIGIKPKEYAMKFADLSFIQEKQGTIKTGSVLAKIYMDANKVFYFVQTPKSLRNELVGSKLMNIILGSERTAQVKLLEDKPKMTAARMIKGFRIKDKAGIGDRKVVGAAELDIAMDFLGVINRKESNIGHVSLNDHTLTPARVDFSCSFQYEKKPTESCNSIKNDQDHLCLDQLYKTLDKYSTNEILPALENLIDISDEQIFVEVVRCKTALSRIGEGDELGLREAFVLASNLIERKKLFKKVWAEVRDNEKGHQANISKIKEKEEKWKETFKEKKEKKKSSKKKDRKSRKEL